MTTCSFDSSITDILTADDISYISNMDDVHFETPEDNDYQKLGDERFEITEITITELTKDQYISQNMELVEEMSQLSFSVRMFSKDNRKYWFDQIVEKLNKAGQFYDFGKETAFFLNLIKVGNCIEYANKNRKNNKTVFQLKNVLSLMEFNRIKIL